MFITTITHNSGTTVIDVDEVILIQRIANKISVVFRHNPSVYNMECGNVKDAMDFTETVQKRLTEKAADV